MSFRASHVALKAAAEDFTSVTFADITSLTLPVIDGGRYRVDAMVVFLCDVLTTGLALKILAPTGILNCVVGIPETTNGTAMIHWGNVRTSGDTVTAPTVGSITATYTATISGVLAPTAAGDITLQAALSSAVGAPTISIKQGSFLRLEHVE